MTAGLTWESVTWRRGEDHYRFDIERGGMFGTLSAPGGRTITLPMIVWEGLLDVLAGNRKTKAKSTSQFPARTGARWFDGETAELAEGYRAGRSIPQLARAHNRSEYAIENQLDKLGLISTAAIHGPASYPLPDNGPRNDIGSDIGSDIGRGRSPASASTDDNPF